LEGYFVDVELVRKYYFEDKLKIVEIAKILGVNKSTVSRVPVDLPRSVYVHKNVLKQFRV